jgi:hypothetical protein
MLYNRCARTFHVAVFGRARRSLAGLLVDRRGFSAVLTGLMLTMLVGFVGLAVDVGVWQWLQRDMQEAADHAAYAAAQSDVELNPGFLGSLSQDTPNPNYVNTSIQTGFSVAVAGLGLNPATFTPTGPPPQAPTTGQCYSSQLAAQQGYSAASNIIQICVIYGQAAWQGNNFAWKVTIAQPRPMWFSKILFSNPSTINVNAIALPTSDSPQSCVIAFAPTTAAPGFLIDGTNGTANVSLTNCDALVSSNDPDALQTNAAANLAARAVYVGGGEINNGLTFSPGPGAAQNYASLASFNPPAIFLSTLPPLPNNPDGGDPYNPTGNNPYSTPPPGTPSPPNGISGNADGCDFYVGDATCPPNAGAPCTAPQPWYVKKTDGPGVYCDNPTNATGTPAPYIPQDGSILTQGLYVLWGVGMQLPTSAATMTYTCQNGGDTYSSATGTCNNAHGKPQVDSPTGTCSGGLGGVNATAGVTIYMLPRTYPNGSTYNGTYSAGQMQLAPAGTGNTCFAINAPQGPQISPTTCWTCTGWSAPQNFSNNYASMSQIALAQSIQGMAIWVDTTMSSSQTDYIGPNAGVAINGAFYDPARTLAVAGASLTGTCSQIDARQVDVVGPATLNYAYCNPGSTYIQSPDYNYLGSVRLVQ